MKYFSTLVDDHVTMTNRYQDYQRLLKDCIDTLFVIPRDKGEYTIIKSKWDILRKEFPGTYIPSLTFYPILLQDYMNNKITKEEYEEKANLWLENLQTHDMLYKRQTETPEKDLKKAYKGFRELHQSIPEYKEVLECIEKHPDVFWDLLSAKFEI